MHDLVYTYHAPPLIISSWMLIQLLWCPNAFVTPGGILTPLHFFSNKGPSEGQPASTQALWVALLCAQRQDRVSSHHLLCSAGLHMRQCLFCCINQYSCHMPHLLYQSGGSFEQQGDVWDSVLPRQKGWESWGEIGSPGVVKGAGSGYLLGDLIAQSWWWKERWCQIRKHYWVFGQSTLTL